MEAIAKARYLRCSARKMRQVADIVRGQRVESALSYLFSLSKVKKSAFMVEKVLKAAIANIKEKNLNENIEASQLVISTIVVDQGPSLRRIRPRAQGRAFRINKKQCHLALVVTKK